MCARAPRQGLGRRRALTRRWPRRIAGGRSAHTRSRRVSTLPEQCVAGIDIGGTKNALALAAPDGPVFEKTRFPTRVGEGPRLILERVLAELERMVEDSGASLAAVGVGCGGPLDRARGLILS